ncbi:MAG TPA: hypothetical protein VK210_11300 [Terriglobia bacterium]|nr:hypothetical protein [Terriglobia bacterium]
MDVTINKTKIDLPPGVATWGDLLDWVETRQLKPGQCITRVLFQGQEEIQYRQPSVCSQGIRDVGPVQIESGEFDLVVKETFAELQTEIALALNNTRDIIKQFENRAEERAHTQLAHLLDSIRIFYSVFSEDLGWVNAPDNSSNLENAIRQLIAAQENRFWVSICDVLEYEIVPILESWRDTVERTRAQIQ